MQNPSVESPVTEHAPAAASAPPAIGRSERLMRPFSDLAGAASTSVAGRRRTLAGLLLGVSMVLACSALLSTVPLSGVRLGTVAFLFLAAVIAASCLGRLIAGLVTAGVASWMLAYEFVMPIHSVTNIDQTGLVAVVSFSLLALLISWLLARQDAAQQQQRVLGRRIALLQVLAQRLSEAVDVTDVARAVTTAAIDDLRAEAAAMLLVDGDRLVVAGDRGIESREAEVSTARAKPARDCLSSGDLVVSGEEGESTAVWVPLVKDAAGLGVLELRFAALGALDASERSLLLAVGAQTAQGLERARLWDSDRASRRSLALLADASDRLSQTLDYEEALHILADIAVPGLADHAIVDLITERGEIRRLAVVGVEPEVADGLERYRPEPGSSNPVAQTIRDGRPRMFDSMGSVIRDAAANDEHRELIERLNGRSAMVVPLRFWGQPPLGVLTLVSSSRQFRDDDLALATDLAGRAATAIEHARLYAEQSAIAQTLQRSLLPARTPAIPGVSVATRYRAVGRGNEVGGDFYDIWEIPGDGFGVAIGDVCGKGAAAAALTSLMRHTVRTASLHEPTPTRVLRVLNDGIIRRVDADRFCTVLYAHGRPVAGGYRLRLSSAGHPLPYLVRPDGTVNQLGEPGLLLGVFDQIQVVDREYTVTSGEIVVLFTDGVTEHRSEGGLFGEERLLEVLRGSAGLPAEGVADAIDAAVEGFAAGPLLDDLAVVVLRFNGAPSAAG